MGAPRAVKRRTNPEQWEAATGIGAALCFGAASGFSRAWPLESGEGFAAFLEQAHGALTRQALFITLATGFMLWFLATLRDFVAREEGATARSGTLIFGAGLLWCGLTLLAQAPQLVLTLPSQRHLDPGHARVLADLCFATLLMANGPLVVMLGALTLISVRTRLFPTWLAAFSGLGAAVGVAVFFLALNAVGAVAPQGWLTIALTPALALWLLPTSIVMVHRLGFSERRPLVRLLARPAASPTLKG